MLDPGFAADCPYLPEGVLLEEILEVDRARSRVVARAPAREDHPLTRAQRVHPVRHPRHVSGGLLVHLTGMMGFAHAYFVLGLRHAEGWTGYGTRIHQARFRRLARVGPPLLLDCRATEVRRIRGSLAVRYRFLFTQEGEEVYAGDQSALWTRAG